MGWNERAASTLVSIVLACILSGCSSGRTCLTDPGYMYGIYQSKSDKIKCEDAGKNRGCWSDLASNLDREIEYCMDKKIWDTDNTSDLTSDIVKVSTYQCYPMLNQYVIAYGNSLKSHPLNPLYSNNLEYLRQHLEELNKRDDKIENDEKDHLIESGFDYAVILHHNGRCTWHFLDWWW